MKRSCRMVLASLMLLTASLLPVVPAGAGVMLRPTNSVFDVGPLYNTQGSDRIWLHVFYEVLPASDGNWAWQLCYETAAEHKNGFGNWKPVNKLYNLTYTFKISTSNVVMGGFLTKVRSGVVNLDHQSYSLGYIDGASGAQPVIVEAQITAQRYGGASGYSVTFQWP